MRVSAGRLFMACLVVATGSVSAVALDQRIGTRIDESVGRAAENARETVKSAENAAKNAQRTAESVQAMAQGALRRVEFASGDELEHFPPAAAAPERHAGGSPRFDSRVRKLSFMVTDTSSVKLSYSDSIGFNDSGCLIVVVRSPESRRELILSFVQRKVQATTQPFARIWCLEELAPGRYTVQVFATPAKNSIMNLNGPWSIVVEPLPAR